MAHTVPRGVGCPEWFRQRVVEDARPAKERAAVHSVSLATVYRYGALVAANGIPRRLAVNAGRDKSTTDEEDKHFFMLTRADPCIYRDEMRQALLDLLNVDYNVWTISRRWKAMGFRLKTTHHYASGRDEDRRVPFWTNSPVGGVGVAGVFGQPWWSFVDVDEAKAEMTECDRLRGHFLRGEVAVVPGVPSKRSIAYNIILAISPVYGVVAYWIYEENTNAQVFASFVQNALLHIVHTILWGNHPCHFTANVATDLLTSKGHKVVPRPTYSHDFAPIESAFSKIKAMLRRNKDEITKDNFVDALRQAIAEITPHDCQGWFQDCHYYVPGREHRPYMGMPTYS